MNRSNYFNYIEEKINLLATRINTRAKLNILDLNIYSEGFYISFLNELFGWKLGNANIEQQNIAAIDLIDHTNKLVIQVSSTNTKNKINSSLKKNIIEQYSSYTFKFISIANDADDLRTKTYSNPHKIAFNPKNDIIDKKSILNLILGFDIDKQRVIFEFIKNELGSEVDRIKLDSNLAAIINILAKENWHENKDDMKTDPFEINRKIDYNNLNIIKSTIDDYKIYHHEIESKYKEFDILGANKSLSALQLMRRYYMEESLKENNPDKIFLNVCKRVTEKVVESGNFVKVEFEILTMCVDILVVDAFIRCKIFENPKNYNYVAP